MPNNVYIDFDITSLAIRRKDNKIIPTDNLNYIFARFNFWADWTGLNKTAILSKGNLDIIHQPIIDNVCQIPNIFMESPGKILISVFGGDRRTVNNAEIIVEQSGFKEGVPLTPTEPTSMYVQTPDSTVPFVRYTDVFEFFADNEWKQIESANGEAVAGIEDAPADNNLYGRINNDWQVIPAHSVDLMFFVSENNIPVVGHTTPTEPQVVLPTTYFPAEPGTFFNIVTFVVSQDLHDIELEFIPGNSFTAKLWIVSDMARNNTQFRLTAIDRRTDILLATGTVSVDLGATGVPSPILITGLYENPAIVPAEDIQMTLQILTPLFGIQIGIISIPPNELSYISRLVPADISNLNQRVSILEETIQKILDGEI